MVFFKVNNISQILVSGFQAFVHSFTVRGGSSGVSHVGRNFGGRQHYFPGQTIPNSRAKGGELNTENKQPTNSSKSTGIGAWGIILLIVSGIVLIAGTYYMALCYPLLCKKERNYDIIEVSSNTSTATTTTPSSREKIDEAWGFSSGKGSEYGLKY